MSVPMGFAHAIIDFWLLGPRRFFDALQTNPNRYLTPRATFAIALLLIALIYFAQQTLGQSFTFGQEHPLALTQGQSLALALVFTLISIALYPLGVLIIAALETLFSRFWPVRSKGKFRSIWNFNMYFYAASIWFVLFSLVLSFAVIQLRLVNSVAFWVVAGAYVLVTIVAYLAYKIPGLAIINGVSYGRMLGNQLLWFFVLMLVFMLVAITLFGVLATVMPVAHVTPAAKV